MLSGPHDPGKAAIDPLVNEDHDSSTMINHEGSPGRWKRSSRELYSFLRSEKLLYFPLEMTSGFQLEYFRGGPFENCRATNFPEVFPDQ